MSFFNGIKLISHLMIGVINHHYNIYYIAIRQKLHREASVQHVNGNNSEDVVATKLLTIAEQTTSFRFYHDF